MNFATLEPLNLSHEKQGKRVEIAETFLRGSKVAKFMSDQEDAKETDSLLQFKTTTQNALVAIIGINEYHENTIWDNLDSVTSDIEKSIKLWNDFFHYDTYILSNYQNPTTNRSKIYRKDILHFLNKHIRHKLITEYNNMEPNRHDALIIMIFGHGADESLITSDGESISYQELKDYLNTDQITSNEFLNIMRLYIIDTCRGDAFPIIKKTRGVGNNNKSVNIESNVCTLYSTPKKYKVADGGFVQPLYNTFVNADLKKHTLYDIFTKFGLSINEMYCPQFESTMKFKLKFRQKSSDARVKPIHCGFEGHLQDKQSVQPKWKFSAAKAMMKDKGNCWKNWCCCFPC